MKAKDIRAGVDGVRARLSALELDAPGAFDEVVELHRELASLRIANLDNASRARKGTKAHEDASVLRVYVNVVNDDVMAAHALTKEARA